MATQVGKKQQAGTGLTDAELVHLTLAGEQGAFEDLMQRYYVPIMNFVRQNLKDYDTACDVCQKVFLRLYTFMPNLDLNESLKSWLFQVARNSCIDEIRRQRRQALPLSYIDGDSEEGEAFSLDEIPDQQPGLEEIVEQRHLQRVLVEAISGLPPKFRDVVALRYATQLKFSEIGKTLGMPEATAKTYFARSKNLLRKQLDGQIDVKVALS